MSRKQRQAHAAQGNNSARRKIQELEQMLQANAEAVSAGAGKKTWYKKDMNDWGDLANRFENHLRSVPS